MTTSLTKIEMDYNATLEELRAWKILLEIPKGRGKACKHPVVLPSYIPTVINEKVVRLLCIIANQRAKEDWPRHRRWCISSREPIPSGPPVYSTQAGQNSQVLMEFGTTRIYCVPSPYKPFLKESIPEFWAKIQILIGELEDELEDLRTKLLDTVE